MDAERAADAIYDWRIRRSPMRRLPDESRPATEDKGYTLQTLLHPRLTAHGWGPVVGLLTLHAPAGSQVQLSPACRPFASRSFRRY